MPIKTEHLKELARLQEIKPIEEKSVFHIHVLDYDSIKIIFSIPNPKFKNDVFYKSSLEEIAELIKVKYNQDLEKRLEDAKKAVWTDIGKGGI